MSTRISRSVSRFTSVRHRTAYRIGLIVVCAVVWTCSTALTSTAAPRTTLMVRVYQTARLPSMLQQRTLAEAELVLRSALADRSEACSSPPAPLELVLVVRDERRCTDTPTTLGKAVIVPDTGGILATVYFSCVERFATSAGTDVAVLLGRVAAHELGHLMLNSSGHARHGLMRRHWTLDEVRLNRPADWVFTAGDVAAMHAPPAEQ